jgi:hypothetical protein
MSPIAVVLSAAGNRMIVARLAGPAGKVGLLSLFRHSVAIPTFETGTLLIAGKGGSVCHHITRSFSHSLMNRRRFLPRKSRQTSPLSVRHEFRIYPERDRNSALVL